MGVQEFIPVNDLLQGGHAIMKKLTKLSDRIAVVLHAGSALFI